MHIVMYSIYHIYLSVHSYPAALHGLWIKYLYPEVPHMPHLGLHNVNNILRKRNPCVLVNTSQSRWEFVQLDEHMYRAYFRFISSVQMAKQ